MDFDAAIKAHANWRLRLFGYCTGKSREKLDVRSIEKDNVCDLGKWLHGEGKRYQSDAIFPKLIAAHAAFHQSAASVAALVDQGQRSAAQEMLESPASEFGKRSVEVVGYLSQLKRLYPHN